jgi:hypothetical protein
VDVVYLYLWWGVCTMDVTNFMHGAVGKSVMKRKGRVKLWNKAC